MNMDFSNMDIMDLASVMGSRFMRRLTKKQSPAMAKLIKESTDPAEVYDSFGDEEIDRFSEKPYDSAVAASKQNPTDLICLKQNELRSIFKNIYNFDDKYGDITFSSDIVFANTIPLKNFSVRVKFDDAVYDEITFTFQTYEQCPVSCMVFDADSKLDKILTGLPKTSVSMVPFDGINEYYKNAGNEFNTIITDIALMTIEVKYKSKTIKDKFVIKVPIDINSTKISFRNELLEMKIGNKDMMEQFSDDMGYLTLPQETVRELESYIFSGIMLYHGINVLLLNPVIQDVFEKHSSKEPIERGKATGKNKRAKIRYIKKHVIKATDIEEAFDKQGYTRHAMIWYVTGHWREYSKTGKRVFIQGYWKGALRHMKDTAFQNLEPREREIVTANDTDT